MKNTKKRCTQRYPFSGKIWCDDHADVYTGSCKKLRKKWGSYTWTGHKGKPLTFKAEATCCEYLYVVAWNNNGGENGLLAEIIGDVTINNGAKWEVYPTGIDFDSGNPRPTKEIIECQLKEAHCNDWKPVTVGQQNDGSGQPFSKVTQMPDPPRFIWYNSGNDSTSNHPPFTVPASPPGFNHDEFLIFRLPMKDLFVERCDNCPCTKCKCDCNDCHGCNENAADDNTELAMRALDKQPPIPSGKGCPSPYKQEDCERTFVPQGQEPQLCFYLHILDSPKDQVEEHDTEIFYLTVCNPYKDLCFNGLRITKISLNPDMPIDKVQIVPDRLICFDCLEPCCCATREFALITRCKDTAGKYELCVEYCYDSIEWKGSKEKGGKVKYQLEIVKD